MVREWPARHAIRAVHGHNEIVRRPLRREQEGEENEKHGLTTPSTVDVNTTTTTTTMTNVVEALEQRFFCNPFGILLFTGIVGKNKCSLTPVVRTEGTNNPCALRWIGLAC